MIPTCQATRAKWARGSVLALVALSAACASAPKPEPGPAAAQAPPEQPAAQPVTQNTLPPPRPATPQVTAPLTREQLIASRPLPEVGDRIYFEVDRHDLTDSARTVLALQAIWLNGNPGKRVLVAGNCDERGTREYNLALGVRRANAVRDYLIGLGVDPARIETVSYGKERPLDPRANEDGWAINRNAHTGLLN